MNSTTIKSLIAMAVIFLGSMSYFHFKGIEDGRQARHHLDFSPSTFSYSSRPCPADICAARAPRRSHSAPRDAVYRPRHRQQSNRSQQI